MHLGEDKWAEVQSALQIHGYRTCDCGEPAAWGILYKGHEHPWILVSECGGWGCGGRPGTNTLQCQGMTAVCPEAKLSAREDGQTQLVK